MAKFLAATDKLTVNKQQCLGKHKVVRDVAENSNEKTEVTNEKSAPSLYVDKPPFIGEDSPSISLKRRAK